MDSMLEEHYVEAKAAAKLYAEAEADLVKLKVAKRATRYLSKMISSIIMILLLIGSVMILLIALGFALGDLLQNTSLGFLCSGIVGLICTGIATLFIRKLVERSIIQKILNELSNV